MNCNKHQRAKYNNDAHLVQNVVAVCANHKRSVDDDRIQEPQVCPVFLALEFVKRGHKPRVFRVALGTPPYRRILWKHQVGNQNGIVYARMALDAPNAFEMQSLVRQPVVVLDNINAVAAGQ